MNLLHPPGGQINGVGLYHEEGVVDLARLSVILLFMAKKKSIKGNIKLPVLIIVFALAVLGIYSIWSMNTTSRQSPTTSKPTTVTPQLTVSALQNTLATTAPIIEATSVDWTDANSQIIPLKGYRFFIGTYENQSMGKYGDFTGSEAITESSLESLRITVENFFFKKGFRASDANNKKDDITLAYGYEMDETKCVVNLMPQSDPFAIFFCGTADTQELAWRKELVPVINATNDPEIRVNVTKRIGNYAAGGVGNGRGGAAWYAVKVNGKWQQVALTQNMISCKTVKQYTIPAEIYDNECSNDY